MHGRPQKLFSRNNVVAKSGIVVSFSDGGPERSILLSFWAGGLNVYCKYRPLQL
jgi:hypothetical protein